MITFSSLGGSAIQCDTGIKNLIVFPEKGDVSGADLVLHGAPEEEPAPNTISWPGEYDYNGLSVRGIGHDDGGKVSYAIQVGNVRCAFLSPPLHDWDDYELELLGDIDILVISGNDSKLLQKMVDEIDPRILIPLPTKENGSAFAEVLKNFGAQGVEAVKEYKQKGSLPAEGREIVVLS